jgi:hypothetical protein
MTNPKSRRRFRILALYEETTGELLAEVFGTTHGRVVVHRSRGRVSRGRNTALFARQGASLDDLVVPPLPATLFNDFTS